jgi:soluble lytic murein transglycosylase-like protein
MEVLMQRLRLKISQSMRWMYSTQWRRLWVWSRTGCALFGFAVLCALIIPVVRESLMRVVAAHLYANESRAISQVAFGTIAGSVSQSEQSAVVEMLAKRFRVAEEAVAEFVTLAYRIGPDNGVDPALLLAVMCVESKFNPVAESVYGAKGLMQIIPRFHMDKVAAHGGEDAMLDPDVNILVGAQVLRTYLQRFGDLETALQAYGGAIDEPSGQYAAKVLAERARIEQTITRTRRAA